MQDRALLCKSTSNSLAAPFMQPPCCASTAPASHQYSYNFPMNQVGTRHQSKDFSHNLSLQTATESFTRRQSKLSHRLMGLRGFGAIGDNYYVNTSGAAMCYPCPENTETLSTGADDIRRCQCIRGFYAPARRLSEPFRATLHTQFAPGMPGVWGQKSGKMHAKVGSPGSRPLACLTSSDGWALHLEHILGGPEGWGKGSKHRSSNPNFGRRLGTHLTRSGKNVFQDASKMPPAHP
eukprot:1161138-Pelagomonas_calceolata.AAC.3